MGNGCPHSRLNFFGYNTLLGQNRVTPRIIRETEEIAYRVSLQLAGQHAVDNLVTQFKSLQDLDFDNILNLFFKFSLKVLGDFRESADMRKYLNKRYGKLHGITPIDTWGGVIHAAFMDIFSLVVLHISHPSNKKRLKGLIYTSMKKGNGDLNFSISKTIYNEVILSKESSLDIEKTIGMTKKNAKQQIKVHSYGEPSCVFAISSYQEQWVNTTWDFFEFQLLPRLQEEFRYKSLHWEKFYSGNM